MMAETKSTDRAYKIHELGSFCVYDSAGNEILPHVSIELKTTVNCGFPADLSEDVRDAAEAQIMRTIAHVLPAGFVRPKGKPGLGFADFVFRECRGPTIEVSESNIKT